MKLRASGTTVGPSILSQEVKEEEDEGHTDDDGGNPPSKTCPVPLENCGSTGLVDNPVCVPIRLGISGILAVVLLRGRLGWLGTTTSHGEVLQA